MADPKPLYQLSAKPGIQRDGTTLDSPFYTDGQWVRFYRGRPRKIGGTRAIVEDLFHPARGTAVFTKNGVNSVYLFNSKGCSLVQVDNNLTGTLSTDVSPTGANYLAYNENYLWQSAGIYDSTGGGENIILAHPGANLSDISSSANTALYKITAGDSGATFERVDNGIGGTVSVSGGVCVLQPYVFVYGNDGYIRNSDKNKPDSWQIAVGSDANEVNVANTKIVVGLPMRGSGQSPAGLFWSLDSLIRASYVGGASVFRYDTIGATTIMSSSSVAELDGYFFWMGIDRFYVYEGKVSELPNQTNLNWLMDNINFDQRQKVWATVVPRWGEIWWHFPFGTGQTECNKAIIYNVREKVWYDTDILRGAGTSPQTLRFPIWCGNTPADRADRSSTVTITIAAPGVVTWAAHNLRIDQEVVFSTTGALPTGLTAGTTYYVSAVVSANTFTVKSSLYSAPVTTSGVQSGTHTATAKDAPSYIAYGHEMGYNVVQGGQELAIDSYIETSDLGFPTGGADGKKPVGQDYFTRLTRVEPDFVQEGDLTLTVIGKEFAQDSNVTEVNYTLTPTTSSVDTREHVRLLRLRITSNAVGGFFEIGRPILHLEPGDTRT